MSEQIIGSKGNYSRFVRRFDYNLVIVTGPCRSGKTSLCKLLAKDNRIEFLDEPWLPMFLPVLMRQGDINADVARELIHAYFHELCNDILLYRRANFRPSDVSSISSFKPAEVIFHRLNQVNSREDVADWVDSHNTIFVITLSEITPFIGWFLKTIEKCCVLHVGRDIESLSVLIKGKRWFSDEQLCAPRNTQPFCGFSYDGQLYAMPWWLDKHEYTEFLESDDHDRGRIYAKSFTVFYEQQITVLDQSQRGRIKSIKFESLRADQDSVVESVADYLNMQFPAP